MMKSVWGAFAALAILASASSAAAEVVARAADSFTLRYERTAWVDRRDIPIGFIGVRLWWDSAHTFSGDSTNLSIDLSPGGCWCERLADGTDFDHGRTVSVSDKRIVFDTPFGPLRGKATKAVLTVTWPSAANGALTPTWEMAVEGPGLGAMADPVDGVMGAGFENWLQFLESAPPLAPEPAKD